MTDKASVRCAAVLDIGKTHSRVSIVTYAGAVADERSRRTPSNRGSGYPSVDTDTLWNWILKSLADLVRSHPPEVIIPVTHGAAVAFMSDRGELATPVMDYESELDSKEYELARPAFTETGSPSLPMGLNLGRQIWWLEQQQPDLATASLLLFPQFWAYLLSGTSVSEVTSLGCHTDLWAPYERDWSSMARSRGWKARFPEVHEAGIIGKLRPEITRRIGLNRSCAVHSGLHDSNASLVPYLDQDAWVLSTGTWFVMMAPGAESNALDPDRDTLVNVDCRGRPVPTARFMGGREFELAGGSRCSMQDIGNAVNAGITIAPCLTDSGGPFPGRVHRPPAIPPEFRAAAATLYVAELTAVSIRLLGEPRELIVEGPAATPAFCSCLAALFPDTRILVATDPSGTVRGAASHYFGAQPARTREIVEPRFAQRLRSHYSAWLADVEQHSVNDVS